MFSEDALRERLAGLATAAGLAVPPLEESTARTPLSAAEVRGHPPGERIVVAPSLVEADAAEQAWHLAACLGWWTSPVHRRRRRQGWAVAAVGVVAPAVLGLGDLAEVVSLPRWAAIAAATLPPLVLLLLQPAMARREQRALEASGHDVLRAAGHDPAALARQVFGGREDPPWFRRLVGPEPAPSARIAAAEGRAAQPERPLF